MQSSSGHPQNPKLMAAVVQYGTAVARVLTAQPQAHQPNEWTSDAWVRMSDHAYRRQRTTKHEWYSTLVVSRAIFHGLPEFALAMAELEADVVIGPQLDQMIGAGPQRSRLEKNEVLDRMVAGALHGKPVLLRAEDLIAAYLDAEARLYATTVQCDFVAPLVGVLDAPTIALRGVELGRLSEREVNALLDTGLLQTNTLGDMALTSTNFCLRMRLNLPKVVGEEPMSLESPEQDAAILRFEEVLCALRLLGNERIALPVIACLIGGHVGWQPLASVPRLPRVFKLTDDQVAELCRRFEQVSDDAVCRKYIRLAFRRLGFASERHRVEDRLVDIVIAAEALFLGGDGERSAEVAYKVSSRYAHFADLQGTNRLERFSHMKRVYTVRSKIVHGDELPGYARTPEELEGLALQTLDHLRWAMGKMLDESERQKAPRQEAQAQHTRGSKAQKQKAPANASVVDWSELLFGA